MKSINRLIFFMLISSSLALASDLHPIAADQFRNGSIFVLTKEGIVLAINLTDNSGKIVGSFDSKVPGYLTDMVICGPQDAPMLYIASTIATSAGSQALISQFSTDGKAGKYWPVLQVVGGLGCDKESKKLYFSSSRASELYVIDLAKKDDNPHFVKEIAGASNLGTIAIANAHAYVADRGLGTVFFVDLAKGGPKSLVEVNGPNSLVVAPDESSLLIGGSGKIVLVPNPTKDKAKGSTLSSNVITPTGIVRLDGGRFAVVDMDRSAMLIFNQNGAMSYSIALAH
jgi:hypothetical protein